MSDWDSIDDTWEQFFGASTDLMPSIMGAIDAIWEGTKEEPVHTAAPKRTYQTNNFANLSHNVQKILANVPDEELNKNFSSEESLGLKPRRPYAKLRTSPEKPINKSNESLEIISPNVQKMLSNLPDVELINKNCSFLHKNQNGKSLRGSKSFCSSRASLQAQPSVDLGNSCSFSESLCAINNSGSNDSFCKNVAVVVDDELEDSFSAKPLGSYLHTSPSGITSRTPVGRKNLGKFLQVPSESSVGTNSTTSSEVSRPVSLTSLGSCSSSSSGGPHQPSSAYLASAESLDSDPEPTGSQGSADSGIAEQPTMSPEQCVLQEVMDTETVYVADLREVIEGYLEPWRTTTDCPLSEHLDDLFSNIEEIYLFNRSFLEDLQQANCEPSLTANAFLHNDSGFSVYTEYCTHYPRTMTVLTELTGDEKMAALFRERQIALGHALPLGSYLLKPVQRILKYHLLLQRLSKQCEHPHKSTIDLALTTMTSVASHINTMKRKHEHAVRVQEIQSQLYGWTGPDLTALGELIAEGTFRVGGARGRRHIFLFDKVLLIAKSKQDGCLAYKSHIMCSNLMLVEQVRGEPLSFHILPFDNPRQQCTLRARSPQHKREWTLQLKRVILENYSAVIPSHARQLVMQLGQNVPEEDANDKWSSPLKQHSTPQYLERRSRIRKSRDFSNRRAASQDRSFASLTSWRRKSEPGIVNQYTTKTLPKRITKIKRAKDQTAKFYTDFSDSENCDVIGASTDSLDLKNPNKADCSICEDIQESSLEVETDSHIASTTLEKVVSDLLMQNEEFQKLLSRQRRNMRDSEPPQLSLWSKEEVAQLPSKSDSLPRDFLLNDQLEKKTKIETDRSKSDNSMTLQKGNVEIEDLPESDLSSQLNDSEHPDHRIYRKSAIRFSLVQRFRAIISEEQKRTKLPTYKQGSESMGAKIANPDYADPKTLFRSSQSLSRCDLLADSPESRVIKEECDSSEGPNASRLTHGQEGVVTENILNSSQNSDYYERLLEKNLSDEIRNDEPSPKSSSHIKRPTKAPPPIPTKPPRLLNGGHTETSKESFSKTVTSTTDSKIGDNNFHTGRRRIFVSKASYEVAQDKLCETQTEEIELQSKGWVKTIVGRFE